MSLILHYHPLSSYCHKVLIALYERGTAFTPQMVDLGDPDARAAFAALWPTAKIPLLEDRARNRIIPETSIMIEYLDRRDAAAPPLLPADAEARLETRLWDRLFDFYVMTPMQAIVANRLKPEERQDASAEDAARGTLAMAYAMIDRHMNGRTWAAGNHFSMADCAAAPALFYATALAPLGDSHPHLAAYFERLMTRPSVARTITEARPYFQYFPVKGAIPERFLGRNEEE